MKKGASAATPTPSAENRMSIKNHINYNRLVNLCLALSIIAVAIFVVGYLKHMDRLVFFGMGMMLCALLFHIGLNPITEEEEDENGKSI